MVSSWFLNICSVQDSNMNIAKNATKNHVTRASRALASTTITRGKVLTIDTMNDRVKQVKFYFHPLCDPWRP